MKVQLLSTSGKTIGTAELSKASTVQDVKKEVYKLKKQLYPERQSVRLEVKGKGTKDSETLENLGVQDGGTLYIKDLGPQIGWSTVFLCEYAGPLFTYLLFYPRPSIIYGSEAASAKYEWAVTLAAICWSIHYAKRILETLFVHRFSNATMPLSNLFKNCSYYWGFAAFVSYFTNHPLYTPPSELQVKLGLAAFINGHKFQGSGIASVSSIIAEQTVPFCEVGNLSIHIALRNLRPPGTKLRKIPVSSGNPYTILFDLVSCPNYTYEIGSWVAFSVMTASLPALIFTIAGGFQMTIWAQGKHRNYKKEFSTYPKQRKAIFPFLI